MPVMVHIGTPGDQTEVLGGGSFETSGTVNPPGAYMSARLRDAAATEIQGESQPALAGYDWTFRFPNAPTDEPLSLIVRGVDPQTFEIGEAMHTLRCVHTSAPQQTASPPPAAPEEPAAFLDTFEAMPTPFADAPGQPVEETAAPEPPEEPEPVALPPLTVNPALAATGELPSAETIPEPAPPRKRTRPAPRKKPRTPVRKAARVPAGRRPKAAPAKASRSSAARRGKASAKKATSAVARKPVKKPAGKAAKTGPKKAVKAAVKRARPAPKKNVKAKTSKVAASAARRGTKPTAKKSSRATAKTNPKKRQGR